ncbi:hypothetical protein PybrP1_000693 [[Pythium] brassicae (nom. inval.)]|nr:hypothetical protein PybrP1_000693 [[Pythium] brassicae (nom. inval.)]
MELGRPTRSENLTSADRDVVLSALLARSSSGVLHHGALSVAAATHKISVQTVRRVWRRAQKSFERTGMFVSKSRICNTGRKLTSRTSNLERLRGAPAVSRATIRAAAAICNIPPTALFREFRNGRLRVAAGVAKLVLAEANMLQRLDFCAAHVRNDSRFDDTEHVVHLDKKHFNLTTAKKRVVLLQDEPEPTRRLRSRRHIGKVMVLVAVARSRWIGGHFSNGKIGSWGSLCHEPAKRSSSHRLAGTMLTKEGPVNKETYREKLLRFVLPAVRGR